MKRGGVDVSRVVTKPGPTGRCTILSCNGQRTMRTCLTGCAKITPEELHLADFAAGGAKWAFLNACERRLRHPPTACRARTGLQLKHEASG